MLRAMAIWLSLGLLGASIQIDFFYGLLVAGLVLSAEAVSYERGLLIGRAEGWWDCYNRIKAEAKGINEVNHEDEL